MNIFKKIFGTKGEENQKGGNQRKFPKIDENMPADQQFALRFTQNGGKFIYCENEAEAQLVFVNIIKEIGITARINCHNDDLQFFFNDFDSLFTSSPNASIYLTNCEYLIMNNGSVLFSSNQLKQKKINELPDIFIVYATTSQLVKDVGEGMRGINYKYKKKKPTGITAVQNFKEDHQDDFLNYGTCPKKMYLILLEDLSN